MGVDKAEANELLRLLNEYEEDKSRWRRGILRDLILEPPDNRADCLEMIDFSKSGILSSSEPRQYVLTLKDGTVIGRGRFGDGPSRDRPGPAEGQLWRVWNVVWVDNRLKCLRCCAEWTPRTSTPEQCPMCLGILDVLPDGRRVNESGRR